MWGEVYKKEESYHWNDSSFFVLFWGKIQEGRLIKYRRKNKGTVVKERKR